MRLLFASTKWEVRIRLNLRGRAQNLVARVEKLCN